MKSKRKPPRKPSRSRSAAPGKATSRKFVTRGVEVSIAQEGKRVALTLDGIPVKVSIVDGEYHCQLAHQFTGFGSIDDIVETLLAKEGRTWTLHGHLCDESCGPEGHGPGHKHGSDHSHSGHHHGHGGGQ
jgi:hypothetical protein